MIFFATSAQQFFYSDKSFKPVPIVTGLLLMLLLVPCLPESSWGKEFDVVAIGVRGGMNFKKVGLPPGEKEDFEKFDLFGIMSLPWGWDYPSSGLEVRTRLKGSVGALRGAGDLGFISTLTPGLAFTKKSWNVTLDGGIGAALISKWEFGLQDIGGPFQFIARGGVSFHLPGNLVFGYRFHHMSDGMIYPNSRGVDAHILELSYFFGED